MFRIFHRWTIGKDSNKDRLDRMHDCLGWFPESTQQKIFGNGFLISVNLSNCSGARRQVAVELPTSNQEIDGSFTTIAVHGIALHCSLALVPSDISQDEFLTLSDLAECEGQ